MTRPSQSSAARIDMKTLRDAPLVAAGRSLAERGHYGMVWADDDLTVTATYGRLVGFVSIGEMITHDLPALVGLESDIRALKSAAGGAVLQMPAVAMVSSDRSTPRLNLLLLWLAEQDSFLCLVMRTGIGSEPEIELAQENRRRLIAEAEVLAKSKELARANRDLENYASIISHDLQSPMRALRYQVDELEEALGENRTEAIEKTLHRMRRQTTRMGNMLSALLEYSSAGRKSETRSDVDTKALVTAVVKSVERGSESHTTITGEWPILTTLEQPLDLVLRNLIDNAIKHHKGSDIRVEVCGKLLADHFHFAVSDNGPGIAPEHQDMIFLPFRTLQLEDGDDVRGLGLAIVQRIVSGVGGTISVQDRKDGRKGAVFCVCWPKIIHD